MEIIIGIVAKVAEYTVRPLLRPIERPFKYLWEYKSNLEKLKNEVEKLEAKSEEVQRLTNVGVEPLPAVKDWQGKVTEISNKFSGLNSQHNPQQQSMECCQRFTCSNLMECYKQRNNAARMLEDVARLYQEAADSKNLWEYKSNLENLKKEVENLEAIRDRVRHSIKDGEEALPNVKDWQGKGNDIINEISGLINPQQQNMQCCKRLICPDCCQRRDNVARKLGNVAELLLEARNFNEVSTITEETAYKNNLEKLKKEVETLKVKRESVQRLIKVGEEPLPHVKVWQEKVNNSSNEASGLTIEHNYEQQNKVARMLKEVAQLLQEEAQFKEVSYRPIPEEPWLQSSQGYKAFESRTSILKEIIEALSKPDVGLAGIYGMGGIGKTTLAKQIAREAFEDKLFNKIVFVEVSQTPDIKKIQGEIGSKLGLEFRETDESPERARRVFRQLMNEEKTLLILDNIWESLNFEALGIPYKHDSKGLKLLMTARKRDVLTNGIEYSQHIFSVRVLDWPDAWSLFKSKAGTCLDRPDLLNIAVDVVKECGGVPLAILSMATALHNKGREEWNNALRKLKNPHPGDFVGEEAKVYQSIEISFENLETEELKETFLLCSRVGSTYDASIEDLLRYGIGLGLFNRCNTMEEERNHVYSLVSRLKASSLLVDAPKVEYIFDYPLFDIGRFAMHDIVCDVGRLLAKRDKNVDNMIDNVIPRNWESEENKLRNCISITLHDVNELSEDLPLICPQLKFLYVKPKLKHSRVSDKFFAWMPKLQVLHLIQMDLQPLPPPLRNLVNLQTFCLDDCVLKDIADIGDLKNLEILSFRHCKGLELPEKLPQLTKLRLLELNCYELSSIPFEFILSFKKLEALCVSYTTIKWEVEKSNNGSKHASHDVFQHLSNLTSLKIRVEDATMLRGLLFPKLERYNITIGNPQRARPVTLLGGWNIPCRTSRFLQVKLNTNEDGIISGLRGIRQLVLDEAPFLGNNFCGLDGMGFPELEDFTVQNNSQILHIVDTASHNGAFPFLQSLILWNLINLKSICNVPLGTEAFHQLRTIRVGKCSELINVFSFVSDRVFQELEEIEVLDCENMEGVFAISEEVHEIKLSKLSILKLTSLPRLESLSCNVKMTTPILPLTSHIKPGDIILEEKQDISKALFNEKVVVTNLETLEINNANVEMIWDNQLPMISSIQNLTCLIISNLANLRSLGAGEYIKFPLLKEMTIQSCPKFKEYFFDDKAGVPSLEKLKIVKMDNLEMICHGQLGEDSFPKLKSLQVQECRMLSTLFRSTMCQSLLSLETLDVYKCDSLEEIFDLDGLNFEERHCTSSTQSGEYSTSNSQVMFSFANLHKLEVSQCKRLKNLFYVKEADVTSRFVFPKLTALKLCELPKLRTFCPGRHTTEWPILKLLKMEQCGFKFVNDETNRRERKLLMALRYRLLRQQQEQVFQFQVGKIWPNLLLTMSSWVQNLTILIVHSCGNLEELFPYSTTVTEELREKKTENTILFPKLNYLRMEQLANLKGLCSAYHIEFPTLKEFKISNCPKLTAFIFDEKIGVPNLEEIDISSMDNLEKIWHNQLVEDSTPKLKSLHARGCNKLLSLLRSNVYGTFLSLKTLYVSDCGSLEEIFNLHEINSEERQSTTSTQSEELCKTVISFANLEGLEVLMCRSLKNIFSVLNVAEERVAAKEAHATAKFVFPKLTSLGLHKLPQLRTFYPTRYTVEWPVLRRFELWDCGIPSTDDEDQMQHPLFLVEKAVPYLKRLILARRELTTMWQGSDTERLFRNFKSLCVHDESKVDYWFYVDQPVLDYMGNVEYMWKDNFILDLILPSFEKIVVHGCDSFISLMPPSASFQCLTNLEVRGCNSLEHIGTFSIAKNLVKLVHLTIRECEKVVEVVGNHGYVTGDKILFSNLKSLSLMDLPSLTSFCVWNFTLEFPSLEELRVSKCPNMKTFSQGDLTTPKLQKVRINYKSIEPHPNIDVNTAIRELREQKEVAKSPVKD